MRRGASDARGGITSTLASTWAGANVYESVGVSVLDCPDRATEMAVMPTKKKKKVKSLGSALNRENLGCGYPSSGF